MRRTSELVATYISKDELEQLRQFAAEQDRTMASVIRHGLRALGAIGPADVKGAVQTRSGSRDQAA